MSLTIKIDREKLNKLHNSIKRREKQIHFAESPETKYFYQPTSFEARYYPK